MDPFSLIGALSALLSSGVLMPVASAVAAVLAYVFGRARGRRTAEQQVAADAARRQDAGRQRVAEGREIGDPVERLRRNDALWLVPLAVLLPGCTASAPATDAGCIAYAEARLARPPAETVREVPPRWADWIADLDDRMTGVCRRGRR
jgi:hypothetical protein